MTTDNGTSAAPYTNILAGEGNTGVSGGAFDASKLNAEAAAVVAADSAPTATSSYEDIRSYLHEYKVFSTVKGGKILDVDLPRKRLSVELQDGTHALVSAPDSFFTPGTNANAGDYYVVDASSIPHHVHESIFGEVFTKVTNIVEGTENA